MRKVCLFLINTCSVPLLYKRKSTKEKRKRRQIDRRFFFLHLLKNRTCASSSSSSANKKKTILIMRLGVPTTEIESITFKIVKKRNRPGTEQTLDDQCKRVILLASSELHIEPGSKNKKNVFFREHGDSTYV